MTPADGTRHRLPLLAACLLLVATATHAFQAIPDAVRALGAEHHTEREDASAYILKQGIAAIPALETACESRDPEIRLRARKLLETLNNLPQEPQGTEETVGNVPDGEPMDPLAAVEKLLQDESSNTFDRIYAILAAKQNADKRSKIIELVQRDAFLRNRTGMILAGKRARDLVEECLKHGAESEISLRTHAFALEYAAWCVFRGTLDKRLQEAQTSTNSAAHYQALLWLTAAKHSPEAAWNGVPRPQNARTQFPIATGYALTNGLLHHVEGMALPSRHATLPWRFPGALHYQTGNAQGLRSTIASIEAMAESLAATRGQLKRGQLDGLADTMLLLGSPERATAILRKKETANTAFRYEIARFRFAEADAIAAEALADGPGERSEIRLRAETFQFRHLDPAEQRRQLSAEAEGMVTTGSVEDVLMFLYRAIDADHVDIAEKVAIPLLRSEKLSVDIPLRAFPEEVLLWYVALAQAHPDRKSADILQHALELHREPHSHKQLASKFEKLVDAAVATGSPEAGNARRALHALVTVGSLLRKKTGVPHLGIDRSRHPLLADAYTVVGDYYADAGNMDKAREYYGKAVEEVPALPVPHYLLACHLESSGKKDDEKRAANLKETALLLAGSPQLRCMLLHELCYRGLEREALRIWNVRYRLGIPETLEEAHLALYLLGHAEEQADRERLIAVIQHVETCMPHISPVSRVTRLAELRTHQGHLALERDDLYTAVRFYEEAFRCSIANVDLFIDAIDRLRAAGHDKAAKGLFEKVEKLLRANLRAFPDSPICLNGLAWFLACTHRKLDDALTFAEKAVASHPGTASYIDTLAEVHFHLGDREKAIELQKKAVALEPLTRMLHDRLKRFEEAALP